MSGVAGVWKALWQKHSHRGGWMTTAVKHKQPRCFFSTCPFYITANELPDFGAEQEKVIRRLAVYHTNSLPEITLGTDKSFHDNAMASVAWIVNEINSNLGEVDLHERWYEDEQTEAITNTSLRESCQYIATISSAIHSSFYKEAEKAAREHTKKKLYTTKMKARQSTLTKVMLEIVTACTFRLQRRRKLIATCIFAEWQPTLRLNFTGRNSKEDRH